MGRFYGSMASVGCANCGANMQALLFNEYGEPQDTDWVKLQEIYNEHNARCSPQNPYENDMNAFYGDVQPCTGYIEEGVHESGYKYCEY